MAQTVMIKSYKNGINLILDPDIPFQDLLMEIAVKFRDSAAFFKNAKLAVSFSGRELTEKEESLIVQTITAYSDVRVICISAADDRVHEQYRKSVDSFYSAMRAKGDEYYTGTLYTGQTLESEHTIILAGDVEAGAKIVSRRNVIVMGALRGIACAGGLSDNEAYVIALDMEPTELRIGAVRKKYTDNADRKTKMLLRRHKELPMMAEPKIALIRDGDIEIGSVKNELLERLS